MRKILTFCGKMELHNTMEIFATLIKTYGDYNCIVPFHYTDNYVSTPLSDDELFSYHAEFIDISTGVVIIVPNNSEKWLDIGSSTTNEMLYAITNLKEIYFTKMYPELLHHLNYMSDIINGITVEIIGDKDSGNNVKLFKLVYNAKYIKEKRQDKQ